MSQYDLVVIGGGAAGLSAALVLSRPRRMARVVDGIIEQLVIDVAGAASAAATALKRRPR